MKERKQKQPSKTTRAWHLLDAREDSLGRIATRAALFLMGKHRAQYMPSTDMGDYVVVINVAQTRVTGSKTTQKHYFRHSWHLGNLHSVSFEDMLAKHPERVMRRAVQNMLPNNRLLKGRMQRLKIFVDANHTYAKELSQ